MGGEKPQHRTGTLREMLLEPSADSPPILGTREASISDDVHCTGEADGAEEWVEFVRRVVEARQEGSAQDADRDAIQRETPNDFESRGRVRCVGLELGRQSLIESGDRNPYGYRVAHVQSLQKISVTQDQR